MGIVRAQPAAGEEPVIVPGDLETKAAAARRVHGIPIEDEELRQLEHLARGPHPS